MNSLNDLLDHLKKHDVKLQIVAGSIRYKDPNKIISGEVLQAVKRFKQDIIALYDHGKASLKHSKYCEGQPIAVSKSQASFLFSELLTSENEHINLALCFKFDRDKCLDGVALSPETLIQVLHKLVQRQPALRLGYLWDDGRWVSRLNDPQSASIRQCNMSAHEFTRVFGSVENYYEAQLSRKFSFDGSALFRAEVIDIIEAGVTSYTLLVIVTHHAICDGISQGLICEELEKIAASIDSGKPLPVAEWNFLDYLSWSEADNHREGVAYWKRSLEGAPDTLHLPMSNVRPAKLSFTGRTLVVELPADLDKRAGEYSATLASTPFALYLATFATLLKRYAFSEREADETKSDIVIGVPFANRAAEHTDTMIGLFMNTLPIRFEDSDNLTFQQAVTQAQHHLRDAARYQDIPLVDIIDAVNPERNASYSPIFQVMMNYIDETQHSASIFADALYPLKSAVAKYDISMILVKHSQGIRVNLEYNIELFAPETIERMAGHFNQMLEQSLKHPSADLRKLDYLCADEKKLFAEFNDTFTGLPDVESPIQALYRYAQQHPDALAIMFNNQAYSYATLVTKIAAVAASLKQHDVGPGDAVGLCLLRGPEMVAAIFACFAVGAHYVPLDPAYPAKRINQICNDIQPKCVCSLTTLSMRTDEFLGDFLLLSLDLLPVAAEWAGPSAVNSEDTAYVIFTSGTTGKPKGIEISYGNLHNLLFSLDKTFGGDSPQRWLAQTSINFDISVVELIWTLTRGHSIVLQQSKPYEIWKGQSSITIKPLDFSIMFFAADKQQRDPYDLLMRSSQFADINGFKAVWMPERHFAEFGGAFASPSVLAGALAVSTKALEIRSGSVVLPLHDPIRVAEEWAMLDNLSQGRVGLSIASGWHPNDFVFQGADFENRQAQMREKIRDLQTLWSGEAIERMNGVGKQIEIRTKPRPLTDTLPLWITSAGNPETFKYAGEIGANVLTHMLGQNLEKLADNIALYHRTLVEHGHDIAGKNVSLMLHTFMNDDEKLVAAQAERPFKAYLASAIKLLEPIASEFGLDIETQLGEIVDLAFTRFTDTNTLIGSPEKCQSLLLRLQEIGVTEVACLIDFGVDEERVIEGLDSIKKAKRLYNQRQLLSQQVNIDQYQNELQLIRQHKPTHVQMTPSQAKLVAAEYKNHSEQEKLSVQHWLLGGEPLTRELLGELATITDSVFYNMYGPTETTVWSAWTEVSTDNLAIGGPITNTQFLLLDANDQAVPVGVPGELLIGGLGVAKGYYRNATLTAEKFVDIEIADANPVKERFYRTGDLLTFNTDGTLNYIGRRDSQLKINGYRVEQEEVESAITSQPSVKDCKVIAVDAGDENASAYLSAYVLQHSVVHGEYEDMPEQQRAKAFSFADGSIIYHHTDRQLALLYREIFEDETYFKHGISLTQNCVVFDVGANVGTFSIDVNQREPTAQVIAFEPIPSTFSALKKNFEYRGINGCVINQGISNKVENVTFSFYPEMAGMSGRFADRETEVAAAEKFIAHHSDTKGMFDRDDPLLQKQLHEYLDTLYRSEQVDCRLTTLSNVIDELAVGVIDLLKIDVEKSECLVLNGIRDEHWSRIRQVVIEIDGDEHLDIIRQQLRENGFELYVEELVMTDAERSRFNTYVLYGHNRNFQASSERSISLPGQLNEARLRAVLEQQLPDYMVPKEIQFVDYIPLMGNGKVDVSALKAMTVKPIKQQSLARPADEMEVKVYALWCKVLKKESVAMNISFFESGGNSIDMVALHGELQEQFAIEVSVIDLFRYTTIGEQASLIRSSQRENTQPSDDKARGKGQARRDARAKRMKTVQA